MNGTESNTGEGGMMQRLRESPRTISALIIILIVAAAIYAFSGPDTGDQNTAGELIAQNSPTPTPLGQTDTTAGTEEAVELPGETSGTATPVEPDATVAPTPSPAATVNPAQLQEQTTTFPEARRTDQGFEEVAQSGDGITHLARRAATRWLAENSTSYNVTNEHRIYIEDYIQNKLGTNQLEKGETMTISYDLVREAAEAAGGLSDTQLQNLSQYTSVLT
jgi:hypothetical protein